MNPPIRPHIFCLWLVIGTYILPGGGGRQFVDLICELKYLSFYSQAINYIFSFHRCLSSGAIYYTIIIIIIIMSCHYHKKSLTLSRHFSQSFIASDRSSGLHPVSSHTCCKYVRASHPAFARAYVRVHRSTSLMSSSLLLQ